MAKNADLDVLEQMMKVFLELNRPFKNRLHGFQHIILNVKVGNFILSADLHSPSQLSKHIKIKQAIEDVSIEPLEKVWKSINTRTSFFTSINDENIEQYEKRIKLMSTVPIMHIKKPETLRIFLYISFSNRFDTFCTPSRFDTLLSCQKFI